MLLKIIKVDSVVCFVFNSSVNTMRSMIRFSEHHENCHFKGKVFTRAKFIEWYTKNSPNGKKTGKFTYYTDWGGSNFTNETTKMFQEGKFNPLSKIERIVVNNLPDPPFAVMGVEVGDMSTLVHEYAHAMFYLSPAYERYATKVVKPWNRSIVQDKLIAYGYDEDVRTDETQAYLVGGIEEDTKHYIVDRNRLTKALRKVSHGGFDQMIKEFKKVKRPKD